MDKEVLELFKAVVVKPSQFVDGVYTGMADIGVVTDFEPTQKQEKVLREMYKLLDVTTLFTREESETSTLEELLVRQILHYVEVYGLDSPGLFELETTNGSIVTMTYVRGLTVEKLGEMVRELIYANRPIEKTEDLKAIIKHYKIVYDINEVGNNELRVLMYNPYRGDAFSDGDDAVRYMCFTSTGSPLLIKSKEVEYAIKTSGISPEFLEAHVVPLSKVFNRHKSLILSAKRPSTRTVVNKISRLSKKNHVPVGTPAKKTFLSDSLKGSVDHTVLDDMSVRDKMKILNLISVKRLGLSTDMFIIRNGKVHFEEGRRIYGKEDLDGVESAVLGSIKGDLAHLRDKKILLDTNVDYGLPVSRKQAVGQLPFFTKVRVSGDRISAGMYWENDWGASDLDLSTIDLEGNRVGWGGRGAYDRSTGIRFSGDITYAKDGAMEFMTSSVEDYGLYVNIFTGKTGCGMELVIGDDDDGEHWINNIVVREKITLESRDTVIGFVKADEYTVYKGRLSNGRVSRDNPSSKVGMADHWTIKRLFDAHGISYTLDKDPEVEYDYDLSYDGFSYDKLEDLLLNKK